MLKKNFFKIGRAGYQKKQNFALISKICLSLEFGEFGKREKISYRKTEYFAKNRFSEIKSWGTS
jgi:hypothetical protein